MGYYNDKAQYVPRPEEVLSGSFSTGGLDRLECIVDKPGHVAEERVAIEAVERHDYTVDEVVVESRAEECFG